MLRLTNSAIYFCYISMRLQRPTYAAADGHNTSTYAINSPDALPRDKASGTRIDSSADRLSIGVLLSVSSCHRCSTVSVPLSLTSCHPHPSDHDKIRRPNPPIIVRIIMLSSRSKSLCRPVSDISTAMSDVYNLHCTFSDCQSIQEP